MDQTTHLVAVASVIAVVLRGLVPLLKSPMFGGAWGKMPQWLRPIVLCLIATVLGVVDALSVNTSIMHSVLAGLAAVGVAVSSYESGKGIKLPKKPETIK